jgi:CubicO group peptidase (beta-lactamase class C family)
MKMKKQAMRQTMGFFLAVAICVPVGFAKESALGPTDPNELEAFMDGFVGAQLEAHDIAGATVSVVKDGALFFAKGYGFADVNEKKPVKADETLFRIGSISKLFVWTSIMQLVEQGKLDLNADVNTYLTGFKIPDTYDKPVTLAHLMTHTAGFEDRIIGLFVKDKEGLLPLGEILAKELPARVRPPGEVAAYSNHGSGIAAYIVEQASGLSWDEYVEQNILAPLGMEQTTFRQPIPEPLAAAASKGYSYGGGEFHEEDFEYVPLAPIGGASATATDLANFMIAHLQQGKFGDTSILDSATARQMHGALFHHTSDVNPMSHGFVDMSMNRQWVIGHGGATFRFHSTMALLPEHDVGLFVSYNSQGGGMAVGKVYEAFMDRYYPAGEIQTLVPAEDARNKLRRFVGSYRGSRYPHRRFTKLQLIFWAIRVTLTEEGMLKTITGRETTRWIETAPLTFREEDGLRTLAFREDEKGRITHMFIGDSPPIAFERVGLTELPVVHRGLGLIAIILFLATVVFWPVTALIRRHYGVKLDPKKRVPLPACILTWSTCFLFVVFVIGLTILMLDPTEIVNGVTSGLKVLLVLPIIAAVLTLGVLVYTVIIWRSRRGGTCGRICYTIITLMCIVFLWQLNYWNLLGFRY